MSSRDSRSFASDSPRPEGWSTGVDRGLPRLAESRAGVERPSVFHDLPTLVGSVAGAVKLGSGPARPSSRQEGSSTLQSLRTSVPSSLTYYVTTNLDANGRLADRTPVRRLNWPAALPVSITVDRRSGIILVRRQGPYAITTQGHLRLPATVRRRVRLNTGDRLLVAALPDLDILAAYTMFALDVMVLAYHTATSAQVTP